MKYAWSIHRIKSILNVNTQAESIDENPVKIGMSFIQNNNK